MQVKIWKLIDPSWMQTETASLLLPVKRQANQMYDRKIKHHLVILPR